MAAVLTRPPPPVPMNDAADPADAADAADPNDAFMMEAHLGDIEFYNALTPTSALPLLGVSGVSCRGYWIGSLPQPPEEEPSDDSDSGEDTADEETKELLVRLQEHTSSPFSSSSPSDHPRLFCSPPDFPTLKPSTRSHMLQLWISSSG